MKFSCEMLNGLSKRYGDTFYLLDALKFRRNYRELLSAFQANYPNTHIAYSYKTNYVPRLCAIVQEEGGYAEVVSEMEYALAKRLGVADNCIYYNGPYKKKDVLKDVLLRGAHVNIDSLEEAIRIVEIAQEHADREIKIGIRCNFDIENSTISRFGIDAEGDALEQVITLLQKQKNLKISGLHCHFPDRALKSYEKRIEKMLDLIRRKINWKLDYISIGGGYFGRIPKELSAQFRTPIPSFQDYGQTVGEKMWQAYQDCPKEDRPALIVEPGSALVADAMTYVARVVSLKKIRGRDIAVLTGSLHNINPNAKGVNRPIEIIRASDGDEGRQTGRWDLTGYTCIEDDVMYRGLKEELQVGDYIVFKNVGSYSIVFKPPFILPNVPVIGLEDGSWQTVKRAETPEDIFCTFCF